MKFLTKIWNGITGNMTSQKAFLIFGAVTAIAVAPFVIMIGLDEARYDVPVMERWETYFALATLGTALLIAKAPWKNSRRK